ncbi:hypothetical protein PENTCL1PPCAC_15111, partial [Pristionchus entomophagus]
LERIIAHLPHGNKISLSQVSRRLSHFKPPCEFETLMLQLLNNEVHIEALNIERSLAKKFISHHEHAIRTSAT